MSDLPFDTVVVAGQRRLTVDEFLGLALSERIRLVLGRKLTFLSNDRPVDTSIALRLLMDATSDRTPSMAPPGSLPPGSMPPSSRRMY